MSDPKAPEPGVPSTPDRNGLDWETAFLTAWITTPVRGVRFERMRHCMSLADDAVRALRETREIAGFLPPSEVPADLPFLVETNIPEELLPASRSFYRLWRAVGWSDAAQVEFYRDQLVRTLDEVRQPGEALVRARNLLAGAPVSKITTTSIVSLEFLVFGGRVTHLAEPPPPEA